MVLPRTDRVKAIVDKTSLVRTWAKHNQTRLTDIRHSDFQRMICENEEKGSHGEHGIVLLIIVRFATQNCHPFRISASKDPCIMPFCRSRARWEQACRGVPFLCSEGCASIPITLCRFDGLAVKIMPWLIRGFTRSTDKTTPSRHFLKLCGRRPLLALYSSTSETMTRERRAFNEEDWEGTTRAKLVQMAPALFSHPDGFFLREKISSFYWLDDKALAAYWLG
ncbi:hypothetical protein C8J56DRAFT_1034889 [Mycena floridula]|nr:hypothetical protein C8J56DRAFT_1034889 [Mycena floridula]